MDLDNGLKTAPRGSQHIANLTNSNPIVLEDLTYLLRSFLCSISYVVAIVFLKLVVELLKHWFNYYGGSAFI